jgi:hypothetical protein
MNSFDKSWAVFKKNGCTSAHYNFLPIEKKPGWESSIWQSEHSELKANGRASCISSNLWCASCLHAGGIKSKKSVATHDLHIFYCLWELQMSGVVPMILSVFSFWDPHISPILGDHHWQVALAHEIKLGATPMGWLLGAVKRGLH